MRAVGGSVTLMRRVFIVHLGRHVSSSCAASLLHFFTAPADSKFNLLRNISLLTIQQGLAKWQVYATRG
jgi:hypothetical protein